MELAKLSDEELIERKNKLLKTLSALPTDHRYQRRSIYRKLEAVDIERLKRAIAKEKNNG